MSTKNSEQLNFISSMILVNKIFIIIIGDRKQFVSSKNNTFNY